MDNERIGRGLAQAVILHYFQDWGQTGAESDKAIRDAAGWAGVDRAQLEPLLEGCFPLGKFEDEANAVFAVMALVKGLGEQGR